MTRQQPLVVDLDGSLLNTDTLHELLIKFLKHHPFKAFLLVIWLIKGKATLKDKLTQHTDINVARLPYNDALIEWLKAEKRAGRKLILATGASQNTANHVARHLNIFDGVHASNASFNCSGKKKRDLLVTEYGDEGYDYVGNSRHDLSVWRSAHKAILVNTSRTTRKRAHKTTNIEKEFRKIHSELFALLKAIRPHQALKNLLLFIPLFTAHQMTDMSALFHLLLGFVSFSFGKQYTTLLH